MVYDSTGIKLPEEVISSNIKQISDCGSWGQGGGNGDQRNGEGLLNGYEVSSAGE